MTGIKETAELFFDACETGKGWEGCKQYCHADAGFSAQAAALTGIDTLKGYTDWMKGLLGFMPDGRYERQCHRLRRVPRYPDGARWSGAADRQARRGRLRLRDAVRRRQDPSHDQDLERRPHDAAARVDVTGVEGVG